jgi:hypothetical protein
MPVIGRLDDQVDAVLISPVGRRNRPEADERDAQTAQDEGAVTDAASPAGKSDEQSADKPRTRETLPVWLL